MKKHLTLCLLLSVSLAADLYAQPQSVQPPPGRIRFEQIPEITGNVVGIVQDHQGFMWFAGGSTGGLHKYDGYQVTTYEHDPEDETSLSDQWAECLLVDRQGTLWIGMQGMNGGLNRFDAATETFTRFHNDPDDPASLSDDSITVLLEDRVGILWVGTQSGGLNRFDPEAETFTPYLNVPGDTTSLSDNEVRAIYEDRDGIMWVGTRGGGLNRFDRETGTFTRYQHDSDDEQSLINNGPVRALFEDSQGNFWVGAGLDGLHTMEREAGSFTRYPFNPNRPDVPSMPYLRQGPYRLDPVATAFSGLSFVHEDRHGKLWIGGCGGGLDVYDPETELLSHYESNPDDPNSLQSNLIWTIYESRDGTKWIGTWGGLFKTVPSVSGYTFYQSDPSDPNSLSHDNVWGLFEDREGIIWIGTLGGGLNRFDTATVAFTNYRYNPDDPYSLSSDNVIRQIVDRSGVLWVGTMDGGLNRFDRENGRFVHYRHNGDDSLSLSYDLAWPHEDSQGTLWVPTFGGGLNRLLQPEGGTFKRYRHDEADTTSLSSDQLACSYEDRARTLWIGSENGLNRFNPDDENFTRFLSGRRIRTIHEDETGRFFVGTHGYGLFLLDRNTGESRRFTVDEGLPSDNIASIVEDEEGFLWISTYQGSWAEPKQGRISHFDPQAETFSTFGPEDGLPEIGFNINCVLKRRDGRLMFGGTGGFITIDPETFGSGGVLIPPAVVLTEFRLFNDRVVPGEESPLKQPIYLTEDIVLRYQQNDFTIDYTGLFYRNPGEIRYRYILENHDEGWVEGRAQRSARYSGMEPGRYVFRVRAITGKGVGSEEDATVIITILPPWWRTGWASALWSLLLIGTVVSAYRVQHARIVRKEREKAKIREAELKAESAELRAKAAELHAVTAALQAKASEAQAEAAESQARTLEAENERNRIELEKAHELKEAYDRLDDTHQKLEHSLQLLTATQDRLIQSQKLASLGQLTAGIAHEIRNPLNFVNNFAEVNEELAGELKETLQANRDKRIEEVQEDLDDIASGLRLNNKHIVLNGKRAEGIVSSMIEHARGTSGERYHVKVNPLVGEYTGVSYHGIKVHLADLNVEIERDFDEAIETVLMSPQDVGRALVNVLNNAFYFVNKKKQTAGGSYEPVVRVVTRQIDKGVEIRVQDNGPGIPEKIKGKVFEPFFTTKPTGSGTGLGLSLAYDIITQGHGGTMTVESEEGRGATFIITLPHEAKPTDGVKQ